jgi:hypothetical protein
MNFLPIDLNLKLGNFDLLVTYINFVLLIYKFYFIIRKNFLDVKETGMERKGKLIKIKYSFFCFKKTFGGERFSVLKKLLEIIAFLF